MHLYQIIKPLCNTLLLPATEYFIASLYDKRPLTEQTLITNLPQTVYDKYRKDMSQSD